MLIAATLGTVVVVAAIIALSTNSWWLLPAALLVHLVATAVVVGLITKRVNEGDKPDPAEEAHIEAGDRESASPDGLTKSGRYGDREVIH